MNAAEEARAAEYRAQVARRAAAERARLAALAGDADAAVAVTEEWQPVIDFLAERRDSFPGGC